MVANTTGGLPDNAEEATRYPTSTELYLGPLRKRLTTTYPHHRVKRSVTCVAG
jgi:hypothetical protein